MENVLQLPAKLGQVCNRKKILQNVCFKMSPQIMCMTGCIITLVAFVWLVTTVCLQMSPQITYLGGGIVTLFAFVWLFSTVYIQVCPQNRISLIYEAFLHCAPSNGYIYANPPLLHTPSNILTEISTALMSLFQNLASITSLLFVCSFSFCCLFLTEKICEGVFHHIILRGLPPSHL